MNRKLLYLLIGVIISSNIVFGYGYVPDFSKMRDFRCDFELNTLICIY